MGDMRMGEPAPALKDRGSVLDPERAVPTALVAPSETFDMRRRSLASCISFDGIVCERTCAGGEGGGGVRRVVVETCVMRSLRILAGRDLVPCGVSTGGRAYSVSDTPRREGSYAGRVKLCLWSLPRSRTASWLVDPPREPSLRARAAATSAAYMRLRSSSSSASKRLFCASSRAMRVRSSAGRGCPRLVRTWTPRGTLSSELSGSGRKRSILGLRGVRMAGTGGGAGAAVVAIGVVGAEAGVEGPVAGVGGPVDAAVVEEAADVVAGTSRGERAGGSPVRVGSTG